MKTYKEGDKSKAIYHLCEAIVITTFKYYEIETRAGTKTKLFGVCDSCGNILSLPPQDNNNRV
jgi:hypothetical protein